MQYFKYLVKLFLINQKLKLSHSFLLLYKFLLVITFIYIINKFKKTKIIFINIDNEINNIKKYYELNNNGTLINKKKFNKINKPKVSIISAVYNRDKFILRFIRSIQNQFFDDIEIIFIDDCSIDNSVKVIEENKKEDERIILLKQKVNKGTLIARNIGILLSKGEYIILPDPDDILSENILFECYSIAKKREYEMIRFNIYSDKYFPFSIIAENLKNPIYQPELSTCLIYGYGYKNLVDGIISNKFIKKESLLKTLQRINIYYLNQKMIYFEDGLINFALYRNIKSLYLLKKIGYYYIYNKDSVSRIINYVSYIKCFFIYIKYVYENTKNNKYEKDIVFYLLNIYIQDINIIYNIKNNDKYISMCEQIIVNIYNDKFISKGNKNKLRKIINLVKRIKKSNEMKFFNRNN